MVGRGGRGLALLEALENQRVGKENTSTQQRPCERTQPGISQSGVHGVVGGRGRAKLADFLASNSEPSSSGVSTSATSSSSSAPSASESSDSAFTSSKLSATSGVVPVGRGRAALLSSTLAQELAKKPQQLESQLKNLKIASPEVPFVVPPVIRHGTAGNKIKATANYIFLQCLPGKGVYEYEVRFSPEIDNIGFRRKLLNGKKDELGGVIDFDGRTLYLPIQLKDQTLHVSHPGDGSDVTMRILYKKKKQMAEHIHFLNILFRRIFRDLDMAKIKREHFSPNLGHQIPQHRLEVWPGYVTAVDEYEGGLMLSIDASHRVLRTITCLEVIEDAAARNPNSYKEAAMKVLIGASVITRYNYKVYTIDDILWDETPTSTFSSRTAQISYMDYYKNQYDIKIRDPRQPLLLNRYKKKIPGRETETLLISLIPELCYMTGLTDEQRADFRLMKDVSVYTRITPEQRKISLEKFIRNVNSNESAKKHLSDWGLRLCGDTVEIEARVFPNERIIFGNRQEITSKNAEWSREATSLPVLSAVNFENWVVIYTNRNERQASDFVGCLRKVAPQMGIDVSSPYTVRLSDDRTESFVKALRDNIKEDVQIVVTICPTSRDDRYAAIKKVTCVERPVASQMIIGKTISKPEKLRSIVQKIALQMNCKLGGSLWAVKVPVRDLMICGIDSYHGGAGSKRQSVGAFVASLNQLFTRWFSRACFQEKGQEMIDGLKICFISALKKYYEVNNSFPERIIVYRDGVGDGQLKYARDFELPQLEDCFRHISPDYCPKLSLVVVQKRINTRIFDISSGREENPRPGTVVDNTITRRNWYDFFLISQLVRQGTVSPAHYIVVKDGCNLEVDHMQKLTYRMTHMYYNWPGTVRVPAPCQYAHKLAFLVGQSLGKSPSDLLSDRLFFL